MTLECPTEMSHSKIYTIFTKDKITLDWACCVQNWLVLFKYNVPRLNEYKTYDKIESKPWFCPTKHKNNV